MKIKIIANNPPDKELYSDISIIVGQIFEAELESDNDARITNGEWAGTLIFNGEYEII